MRPTLLLLGTALLVGCGDPPAPAASPSPEAAAAVEEAELATPVGPTRAAEDPAARAKLDRLTKLAESLDCPIEARNGLLALYERFPDDPAVRAPLMKALQSCDDWLALSEVADARAGTPDDLGVVTRAKLQIKAKRFDDAVALLQGAVDAGDPEARWALGLALFEAGDRAEAAPHVEAVAAGRAAEGRSDALVLQGLIRLEAGDAGGAVEPLRRATEVEPANPSAWNGLGRALARAGDTTGSTAAFDEAERRHAALSQDEAAAFRLSGLVQSLKSAYADRRFADAQALIDELLPIAPTNLQRSLWEMRAAIHTSLGETEAAATATARMNALGGTP